MSSMNEPPGSPGGGRPPRSSRSGAEPHWWRSHASTVDPHGNGSTPSGEPRPFSLGRRAFLRVMGASVALAGLASCRWPEERILPHSRRPEGHTPGVPEPYATCSDRGGAARPLLVDSYDGRPIKVEGNPDHPLSSGASDPWSQAAVLELCDPDRARLVRERSEASAEPDSRTWESFQGWWAERRQLHDEDRGEGLRILAHASSSPTLAAQRARLLARWPRARWITWDPLVPPGEQQALERLAGQPGQVRYALQPADTVVSFDADLLYGHPAALAHARDFARRREPVKGRMSRLLVVESGFSVTGAAADHRHPLAPSRLVTALGRVAMAVAVARPHHALAPAVLAATRPLAGDGTGDADLAAVVSPVVDELLTHPGASVLAVGRHLPPAAQALGLAVNWMLGNMGRTVHLGPPSSPASDLEGLARLARELKEGAVSTLLVLGGNPVYDAPADLDLSSGLERCEAAHLTLYANETTARCRWQLPQAHFLEAWGDGRAWDASVVVAQPLVAPLHEGRSALELLSMLLEDEPAGGYDLLRRAWGLVTDDETLSETDIERLEQQWRAILRSGRQAPAAAPLEVDPDPDRLGAALADLPAPETETAEPVAVFQVDASVLDGRYANLSWLQELPDPLTRLTWDNAALVGPETARSLDLHTGDRVRLSLGGRSVEAPVLVLPGQPQGVVGLPLGYGRTTGGRVCEGVGFDACALRTTEALHHAPGLAVQKLRGHHALASTQDHFPIDPNAAQEREDRLHVLVRDATLEEFTHHPDYVSHRVHHPPLESLWEEPEYDDHKWGMAIDLNRCIGCGACTIACQAENNIPVVGKREVLNGREMHWIRVDRYFGGDPAAPQVHHQPLPCMHCEMAPCEQVCPVAATQHSDGGINTMVYNRCVGTRYCANNCPYKVRRFNFLNYQEGFSHIEKMRNNPGVTVRSRGVMEKCSFCYQRIQREAIPARNEGRAVPDGAIVPACAQVCPTGAIVFGDLNDPDSHIAALQDDARIFDLLPELNLRVRTRYLARIRNPRGQGSTGHSDPGDGHHGGA